MEPLEQERPGPKPAEMLAVLLLVIVGTATRWGNFCWEGFVLVLAASALALWVHARPSGLRAGVTPLLTGMLLLVLALSCCLRSGQDELQVRGGLPYGLNAYGVAIKVITACALLLALTYVSEADARLRALARHRFMLLVLAAAAIRVLILVSSPAPKIDVFHVQTEGAKGLLERHNVYAMAPARPAAGQGEAREFYGYQYPPTAFYPVVASWVLFKDVRAMWVVCDLVAALLLYLVARRMSPGPENARYRQLLVLTYLFLPRTLFVLESAWMEPLIVAAMAGLTLALASARGPFLTGLLMAVWFGSKQYMVLALPFFLKLRRAGAKAWAVAIAAGVILALPFVLWDWRALWEKVGLFILQSPGRPDALSIYGALLRNGVELPGWIGLILWLAAMVWLTWKMPRTLSGWLFSTATLWVVFFLVGKWAFMNYFHLVIGALFLAVAAHPLNKGEDTG